MMDCQIFNCENKASKFVLIPYFGRTTTLIAEIMVCDKHKTTKTQTEIRGENESRNRS